MDRMTAGIPRIQPALNIFIQAYWI